MVPAHSHKVSRVSWYSGSCHARSPFVYGAFTLSGWLSQNHSTRLTRQSCSPNPGVHALRFGLFRVRSPLLTESHVVFSSSGYLDVSVHRVPFHSLWIGLWILEVFSSRFPHSDISGSQDICSSPKLFAAYHVFHRLLVPRHPPCALISLTTARVHSVGRFGFQLVSLFPYILLYGLGCLLFNNSFNMRFSRYVMTDIYQSLADLIYSNPLITGKNQLYGTALPC